MAQLGRGDEGPIRVLAVDDHLTNRMVMETILELISADVVLAEDGAQAVTAFQTGHFDVVLMDLQMPIMDGLTATRRIRDLERASGAPRTPVLAVTANTLSQHVEAARQAGVDRHLAKPITPDGLLAAMATVIGEVGGRDGTAPGCRFPMAGGRP